MNFPKLISALLTFILTLSLFLLMPFLPSKACTVFNKSSNNKVLFGNVENEAPQHVAELHFIPPNDALGKYGNFFILYNGNIAGGMNDQGLCFDVAALPAHTAYTGKPHGDLMDYLLNDCATINDALAFFSSYYWPGHNVNHLMVMDSSGTSVVVELIGSSYYMFYKDGESQVMTNFSMADPEIRFGDYPCPRYEKANNMLDTMDITVSNFQKVCEKVSHAFYDALYTSIYNPNTLEVHFFNANISNSQITTFHLVDEFKLGSHYYILKNNQIILGVPASEANVFSISGNAPNPFNNQTSFTLNLSAHSKVNISIFDIHGSIIATLENGKKQPGSHNYKWQSISFPKGLYFCKINVEGIIEIRKWLKH